MASCVIVWDLETVPDLRGFAAAKNLDGKSDEEISEAMGDKFPKHIYHLIICIGAQLPTVTATIIGKSVRSVHPMSENGPKRS
jgi:hypothetical protein